MTGPTAKAVQRPTVATGAFIGGTFGAVWLIASANTPLGSAAATAFRLVGILGFVALALGRRRGRQQLDGTHASGKGGVNLFGRAYWQIVSGEVALLTLGFAAFAAVGAPSEIYGPWTAVVVALHFIAFRIAGVWRGNVVWPVVPLLAVGAAGLFLAFTSAADWVALVTGVGAGLTLLGGSLSVIVRGTLVVHRAPERAGDRPFLEHSTPELRQ